MSDIRASILGKISAILRVFVVFVSPLGKLYIVPFDCDPSCLERVVKLRDK
jgi:hypothetical protein